MSNGGLNAQVDEMLSGSFDLHLHAGPDARLDRRLDALEAARDAQEAGTAGFVLKNHDYSTAPLAHALRRMYPGLNVAGSICLNNGVGGLNATAVEVAARLDARVVWMPTIDAYESTDGSTQVVDENGVLTPAVVEILDLIREHQMVLASGHLPPTQVLTLFTAAKEIGIDRLIATHPSNVASMDQMRAMAALGAYLEFTFLSCMPFVGESTPGEMASAMRVIGVERCVVTSDFGQALNPPPAEGMRMAIASLLHVGMSPSEISKLVKENPLRLIQTGGS